MTNNYDELFIATTDTVIGIGAPISKANELLINELKRRPDGKKLIIMVSSIEMAKSKFGKKGFDAKAEAMAREYWPGPYTLACNNDLALRMPNSEGLLALIESKGPIYMTSANFSGKRPMSFKKARRTFRQITNHYDFGKGSNRPSTIIKVDSGEIIRR